MTAPVLGSTDFLGDADPDTPWYYNRKIVALAVAVALAAVVVSVLSLSSLARDVSRASQESHANSEVLRVSAGVQTQLTVADGFRQLSGEIETGPMVDDSNRVAVSGIENLADALQSPFLGAAVKSELQAYLAATQSHLNDPTGDVDLSELHQAYDALVAITLDSRQQIRDDLQDVNSRMNTAASIAGFIIAFVVPASGLYVWQSLGRSRSRKALLEHRLKEVGRTERAAVDALSAGMSELKLSMRETLEAVASSDDPELIHRSQNLAAAVRDLEATTMARGPVITSTRQPISISGVLVEATRDAHLAVELDHQHLAELKVRADADLLRTALADLFRLVAASSEEASPVQVEALLVGDRLQIGVHQPGAVENDAAPMVYGGATPADRGSDGFDTRVRDLLNLRYAVEAAGGSITFVPESDGASHVVTLECASSQDQGDGLASSEEAIL